MPLYYEKKRIQYIVKRQKRQTTKKKLLADFNKLLEGITIVPENELKKANIVKAEKLVADIDPKDMHFIALHLQIKHKI